jgi:hypothetical protein
MTHCDALPNRPPREGGCVGPLSELRHSASLRHAVRPISQPQDAGREAAAPWVLNCRSRSLLGTGGQKSRGTAPCNRLQTHAEIFASA